MQTSLPILLTTVFEGHHSHHLAEYFHHCPVIVEVKDCPHDVHHEGSP